MTRPGSPGGEKEPKPLRVVERSCAEHKVFPIGRGIQGKDGHVSCDSPIVESSRDTMTAKREQKGSLGRDSALKKIARLAKRLNND
jgi:hypothetical protein